MSRPARAGALPWLVVVGVLVAALSLRGPLIALTPVLPEIRVDLGIGASAAGLLTTAPVLMFAVITPIAALIIRRAGPELALLTSLSGVLVGTLVRALPGYPAMLVGMVIMGASITIGNVVIPVIIRRDIPPELTAVATGSYVAMMNIGALLTALCTAPLAEAVGWSPALLAWGGITVLGLALWLVHIVRARRTDAAEQLSGEAPARRGAASAPASEVADGTGPLPVIVDSRFATVVRRPVLWLLLVAIGLQSLMYYGLSTWLPTMLIDLNGADASGAGAISSIFQGGAVIGALIAPLLIRAWGMTGSAVTMGAAWLTMMLGMLFAPELAWLWSAAGSLGHSAGFVVVITAVVRSARSDAEAATTSAMVQGGGYFISSFGAPLLGALNEASGGWDVPLLALLGVVAVYAVALITAMRIVVGRR